MTWIPGQDHVQQDYGYGAGSDIEITTDTDTTSLIAQPGLGGASSQGGESEIFSKRSQSASYKREEQAMNRLQRMKASMGVGSRFASKGGSSSSQGRQKFTVMETPKLPVIDV